jgi:integrase
MLAGARPMAFRHALRVSELVHLRWQQIHLDTATTDIRRAKNGAWDSPSSRQQLVEQKKPGSRPGFSFIGACPDRGLHHRPVRRHRAVRR